jgi:putative GTP pyrophosphokinase
MGDSPEAMSKFDFNAHRESAIKEYTSIRPLYQKFTEKAEGLILEILIGAGIRYHKIEARAKGLTEFGDKAAKQSELDPEQPKYTNPLEQITDKAGIRVITLLPRTVGDVCRLIEREFSVIEEDNKTEKLFHEGKFGYQSVHYLVKMNPSRSHLPEYQSFSDLILEIQVRTILQHAWAELEHDIQYKSTIEIPILIKRRFDALAALLDIADLEFQTLQDEYESKRKKKEKIIETYIRPLVKAIAEGDSIESAYAIEALKDLTLQLESEYWMKKQGMEDII